MANLNLNKVIMGGRMVADPELKQTQSGVSVTSFRIAVNRHAVGGKDAETDFFTVTAWRQTAEFICRYFKKGSSICIIGTLQNRSYEKNGEKRTATEIVAESVEFVDSRAETSQDETAIPDANAPTAQNLGYMPSAYTAPKFDEIKQDEDLPF